LGAWGGSDVAGALVRDGAVAQDENFAGLAVINRELIVQVEAMESSRRVVLDIDDAG